MKNDTLQSIVPDGKVPLAGPGFLIVHNSNRAEFTKEGTFRIVIVGNSFTGNDDYSLCFETKEGSGEQRPEPPCYPRPSGGFTPSVRRSNLLTLWKAPYEADLVEGYYTDESRKTAHLRWTIEGKELVIDIQDLNV